MTRFKAIVEYNGLFFCGMQKQKIENNNKPSVQYALEKSLQQLTSQSIDVYFCGRTDSGVHSIGQVIHFDLEKNLSEHNIMMGMNFFLRQYKYMIVITKVEIVDSSFHSRFSCIERTYIYKIFNRKVESVIYKNLTYHVNRSIDIHKMKEASNYLIGDNIDFTSFRATDCQAKSPFRTINNIIIAKEGDTDIINVEISAQSFLYHMVRNIVGALVYISVNEKMKPDYMQQILDFKNRQYAPETAPAYGLYFYKAKYS